MSEGLTRYGWFDQLPENSGLFTKTQLGRLGMKPGGPPRAYIYWRRRDQLYYLYRFDEAVEKREISAKQRAALDAARQIADRNARTCHGCGQVKPYRLRKGEHCHECEEQDFLDFLARHRRKAALWAKKVLSTPGAVILDFETTDLGGYAVEVSILSIDGIVLFDSLINPQCPIEAGAEVVHGITQAVSNRRVNTAA